MADIEWYGAVDICEEIQELIEDLPERASDYATSIGEKVADMRTWIEENENVTQRQVDALRNMKDGCENWLS
jgi:spore coat protein CotH